MQKKFFKRKICPIKLYVSVVCIRSRDQQVGEDCDLRFWSNELI